ncbi:hypothetical protein BH23VER1_BH23VER1_08560 [soil metagenome]
MRILLLAVTAFFVYLSTAAAVEWRRPEILFLGSGGPHEPKARYRDLCAALGVEGFNFTYTEDLDALSDEGLAPYDALLIYANIEQGLTPEREKALLEYVRSGKGFVPVHCASYCFLESPAYTALVGGRFKSHGFEKFWTRIVEPDHPVMKGFTSFETEDETYVHEMHNPEERTVLQLREDEPFTWVRSEGEGRVFYTAYGHDSRTWDRSGFIDLLKRGILWSLDEEARAGWSALDLPALTYFDAIIPNYERRDPPPKPQNPLTPEESVKFAQVPADMKLELVAAEPLIVNPIYLSWDERGRPWVIETTDYPNNLQSGNTGNDSISILEDTDGDGRADTKTVFADKLSIPTTLVFANGGILITDGPDVVFLRDTDGDDRADERTVLFTGINMGDTHAAVSNFRYGADNWIYATTGYSGFDGEIAGQRRRFATGVFRFKPDGSGFEFLQNTTNNTWGLGFTADFDVLGSTANNNPSFYLTIPQRFYAGIDQLDQPKTPRADATQAISPITKDVRQVDVFGGFTAAAGHAFWDGDRVALICEPTGHLLYQGLVRREGTSWSTTDGGNLYASADAWSAPVCAEVGPDGNVWICDWYNVIVQHNPTPTKGRGGYDAVTGKGNAYQTPLRDKEHGRIYRIVPKNSGSDDGVAPGPLLSPSDPDGLVAALSHPNLFWRTHAQRLLVERGQKDVVPALVSLTQADAPAALHALYTLDGLVAAELADAAAAACAHPSAGVRRAAVQLAAAHGTPERITPLVVEALADEDARVAREALLAVADLPPTSPGDLCGALYRAQEADARFADDPVLLDAAVIAASRHAQAFLAAAPAPDVQPPPSAASANLLPNPSFEEVGDDGIPVGWRSYHYGGAEADFAAVSPGHSGERSLKISASEGSDTGLKTFVDLEPGAEYLIEAHIRTDGIRTAGGAQGAMLNLEEEGGHVRTPALKGTSDGWQHISEKFRARGGRTGVNCLYGAYGLATGTAFWDDVSLTKVGGGGSSIVALVRAFAGADDGASEAPEEDLGQLVLLQTVPQKLLFAPIKLTAKAGEKVTLRFYNNCDLPHNVVLCQPGTVDAVGTASEAMITQPDALSKSYIPDVPGIIAATALINHGEIIDLTFQDPQPGIYPFVCTFPGHWRIMQGELVIE